MSVLVSQLVLISLISRSGRGDDGGSGAGDDGGGGVGGGSGDDYACDADKASFQVFLGH